MFKRKHSADGLTGEAPARSFASILPFGRFGRRSAIVALDIDGATLHVVQASGHGPAARIQRFDSAPLEISADKRDQPEALGAALRQALANLKLKPKEAVLALSRGQVVLRPLQVPVAGDPRELAALVNFQIAKDLPFRVEDAAIDFKVLRVIDAPAQASSASSPASGEASAAEAPPQRRLEVLVGAVKADVVEFYRDVARAAGFKLAGLGLRSVAAAHCVGRCAPVFADSPVLLVSARAEEVTLDVILDGKLVFSRAAVIDRESLLATLEIETVRSLHGYEGAGGALPIQKILVAGETGLESEIAKSLSARLGIPAELLDLSAGLKLRQSEQAQAARAAAPIGLALSALEPGGLAIDFANPKKPAAPRNTQRTKKLLLAAACVTALIGLLGTRAHLVRQRLQAKQAVQLELTEAEKKLPIYKRLRSQAKAAGDWTGGDLNWLDHLAYLSVILPAADEIYISAFSTTPQHVMRFSVQSKTGELLAELDKKLRAAGYEVKPLSITPANDRHGYNFRTIVELAVPKKMKLDFHKLKPPARPADDASLALAGRSAAP